MRHPCILLVLILLASTIIGCGGSGSSKLNLSGYGEITYSDEENVDGSLFDAQAFHATRDGYVEVTMESDEVDSYIVVYRGTNEELEVAYDDDGGASLDAKVYFFAYKDEVYTAKFTTYGEGPDLGDYRWSIQEVDGINATKALGDEPSEKKAVDLTMKREKSD